MKGFKQFLFRGSVLDLAVAVVMGAAFTAVVTALVKDLITPLIAALVGSPDFSAIAVTVNGSKLLIGDFLNAVIGFLLMATAVYFFIVLPVNHLMARMKTGEDVEELKGLGVAEVFTPGAPTAGIVDFLRENVGAEG